MKNQLSGKLGFTEYYKDYFSSKVEMSRILSTRNKPILLVQNDEDLDTLKELWTSSTLHSSPITLHPLPWFPHAILWPQEVELGTKLPGADEGLFYAMNASSLLPVVALDPQENDLVLDACAAPGGKTLATCSLGHDCKIVANDRSPNREKQMHSMFKSLGRENVTVIRQPAETIFKKHPDTFDRILLDAPCSSEKHVWQNEKQLSSWSHKRIKRLSQEQYALLAGLTLALKPGGRLVYSTCAINKQENEMVVEKFLQKKGDQIKLVDFDWSELPGGAGLGSDYSYDTNWVRRITADNNDGLDPMFIAVFEKL